MNESRRHQRIRIENSRRRPPSCLLCLVAAQKWAADRPHLRQCLLASKQKTSKLPDSKKVNEPTHSLQRDLSETIELKFSKKKRRQCR